jgi:hypothetical protein
VATLSSEMGAALGRAVGGGKTGASFVAVLASLLISLLAADAVEAAFPGENGKIAYVRTDGENDGTAICTVNLDGTGRTCLTSLAGIADAPAWSPDGQKIA